jgi:peroxiredoxin
MKKRLRVGEKAKDFVLRDQDERIFRLSAFRGRNVLLSFHPLAWTSVCSAQMKSLEKTREAFASLNTEAVGISVDSVPCKKAWAEHLKLKKTRILADFWPHGGVAARYGLFIKEIGVSKRANVIIDERGNVLFARIYPLSRLPDVKEIVAFLRARSGKTISEKRRQR